MSDSDILIELCQFVGQRIPIWTQGAGSNLSVKTEDKSMLLVKASGFRLDAVTNITKLVSVDIACVRSGLKHLVNIPPETWEEHYALLLSEAAKQNQNMRPSMETGFHVTLPRKYVAHFHSLPGILMGHHYKENFGGWTTWEKRQKDLHIEYIAPCKPGLELTERIAKCNDADVYLLANHGVVLQCNDPDFVYQWMQIEKDFLQYFNFKTLLDNYENKSLEYVAWDTKIPVRFYFPDQVIFWNKLTNILAIEGEYEETLFATFKLPLSSCNRDLLELWAAVLLLTESEKKLDSLPESCIAGMCSLPTERFRIAKKSSE